jgi:stage II sporulation protein AB (anti-sigma F factor)
MQAVEEPLELALPVERASVPSARHAAGDFAAGVGAERQDVELAVSEAVSNSVVHGYPSGMVGTITVRAEMRGAALIVVVRDDGTGLRPDLESKGIGLGLPLIARVSDEYRIEDLPVGGTVVTMRFGIEPGAESVPVAFAVDTGSLSDGRVALVDLAGEIDLSASPQLEAALGKPSLASFEGVLVDMTRLRFIDSSGIRALLVAGRRFALEGLGWALALGEASAVRRTLTLSGLEDRFPLHGSREEALASLAEFHA